jgi:translation initiation factor IF-3
LIDEEGKNLGETPTSKAIKMAQDKGLDLIEVAPNVRPPVCKILSWSKFKYDLSKKKRGSSKGKAKEMKEMWFSPYISSGDVEHKLKRVKEFLDKKHPVKLTIRVKGRVQWEMITAQLEKILKLLEGSYETEERPKREGRNLAITIFPLKAALKKEKEAKKEYPLK